jgi:hypothetical protein
VLPGDYEVAVGALTRATLAEVEELNAGDPMWWPVLCMEIAEKGVEAIYAEKAKRVWAWGALWGWIVGDEKREAEFNRAREAYANLKAMETVAIAENATPDNVGVAKLRVDTNFRFAAKVDRPRWGEKVEMSGGVVVMDAGLVGMAGALLSQMRLARPEEKLVEGISANAGEEI